MKIPIADVRKMLKNGWSRVVSEDDASYVADAVVNASLSKDERMNPLGEALTDLEHSLKVSPRYSISVDRPSCKVFDFHGSSPFGLIRTIHHTLRDTAKEFGFASLALKNTAGVHQLSTWIEPLCSNSDVVALFMWNGGSYTVAPFGSKEPFFGTNPLAYGIPTEGKPIICDMATSEVPFLSLMNAIKNGRDLPFVAGLNAQGKQTHVAKEIFDIDNDGPVRLLPMGKGTKGSALMLFIEILTGAMIGAKMGREATDARFVPEEFGGWMLVWDISSFGEPQEFKKRVSSLCEQIRASQKADGCQTINLPGDRSWRSHDEKLSSGMMDINEKDHDRLLSFSKSN